MNLKNISTTALSVGALSLMSLGALAPAAQAESIPSSSFNSYTASNGLSSSYHIYDAGVDYSKNPGVVFYFDGDYWNTSQSKIWDPNNSDLIRMAQVANERNMVFIPVISPDKNAGGDGITWWEDADVNGDFFRSLASSLIAEKGLNSSQVWTIGYSGGAEFQTFELAVDRQSSWRVGGGSIMIGGGGSNGLQAQAAASDLVMPMHWWVGQNDGEGVTWPTTWSAYGAAHQGKALLEGAGFTNTAMHVIPGVDHYGYDFPEILRASLDAAGWGLLRLLLRLSLLRLSLLRLSLLRLSLLRLSLLRLSLLRLSLLRLSLRPRQYQSPQNRQTLLNLHLRLRLLSKLLQPVVLHLKLLPLNKVLLLRHRVKLPMTLSGGC